MSTKTVITLRLPRNLVARARALVDTVNDQDEMALMTRTTLSIVLRMALQRGLESLEEQATQKNQRRKPRR